MKTGLVIALAALAAGLGRFGLSRASAAFAGIAAAIRPEIIPLAAVVSSRRRRRDPPAASRPPGVRVLRGALALGPPFAVALIRLAVFGRAARSRCSPSRPTGCSAPATRWPASS